MPMFLGPNIDFLGGGPLFETLICQFVKAGKSFFSVGDHFRDLYDAKFMRPPNRFLGGGALLETSRCQFVKAGKSFFSVGTTFRDLTMPIFGDMFFLTVLSHYSGVAINLVWHMPG